MNARFICVIVLVKCVFTCSIFVDSNTKKFLRVLGVFGKYFVFTKTENFQKQCCLILATSPRVIQVTCYSHKLACWFWWLVQEWKVQSREVHRDFRGSVRDSLTSRPSSREIYLEIFFTILSLSVLVACLGDLLATCFSREKRLFYISKTVFKTFSVFSLEFLWLFTVFPISFSTKTDPNTPQTPFLHHFFSNLQEKVWVFSVSLHFPCFEFAFLVSMSVLVSLWFCQMSYSFKGLF